MRVIANGTEFRVCECNDGSIKAFGKGNALSAPYDIERNCIIQCISYISPNGNKCERRAYARCKDMPGITSSCSPVSINYEGKCIPVSGSEWEETIVPCELKDNNPIEHCTYEIIRYYNVCGIECTTDNNAPSDKVHEDVTTNNVEHKVHVDVTTPMLSPELEAHSAFPSAGVQTPSASSSSFVTASSPSAGATALSAASASSFSPSATVPAVSPAVTPSSAPVHGDSSSCPSPSAGDTAPSVSSSSTSHLPAYIFAAILCCLSFYLGYAASESFGGSRLIAEFIFFLVTSVLSSIVITITYTATGHTLDLDLD